MSTDWIKSNIYLPLIAGKTVKLAGKQKRQFFLELRNNYSSSVSPVDDGAEDFLLCTFCAHHHLFRQMNVVTGALILSTRKLLN